MKSRPFSAIGLTSAQVAKGFARFRAAISQPLPPFFGIEAREDGFLVTCYNPQRIAEMKSWFMARGYPLQTVNGQGWHAFGVDADTALLAKLTFGGAA